MIIRPATAQDAERIAKLINMAMLEITFQFIGKADEQEANHFLSQLVQEKNNQYSYQHIYVVQEGEEILGQICIYDGAKCNQLRQAVWDKIKKDYGINYYAESETEAGEMYIDSFAIHPSARGKGIGKLLLDFAIKHFVIEQQKVLGLLVDKDNPNAKRLYENIGFQVVKERAIFGKTMEHMQYKKV